MQIIFEVYTTIIWYHIALTTQTLFGEKAKDVITFMVKVVLVVVIAQCLYSEQMDSAQHE